MPRAAPLVLACGGEGEPKETIEPIGPNVLIVFTDDQRFDSLQTLGNPYIETPHLDRIADEGVAFERADPRTDCPALALLCIAEFLGDERKFQNFVSALTPEMDR